VSCVATLWGKKYFCASTNITLGFEVKNKRKSAEEANTEHLLLLHVFFGNNNAGSAVGAGEWDAAASARKSFGQNGKFCDIIFGDVVM